MGPSSYLDLGLAAFGLAGVCGFCPALLLGSTLVLEGVL